MRRERRRPSVDGPITPAAHIAAHPAGSRQSKQLNQTTCETAPANGGRPGREGCSTPRGRSPMTPAEKQYRRRHGPRAIWPANAREPRAAAARLLPPAQEPRPAELALRPRPGAAARRRAEALRSAPASPGRRRRRRAPGRLPEVDRVRRGLGRRPAGAGLSARAAGPRPGRAVGAQRSIAELGLPLETPSSPVDEAGQLAEHV